MLFGHHFAAIAAAGPLIGPVLAAQFGYAPCFLWILIGAVLAGAVHDMVVLFASVRYQGQSLSMISEKLLGKRAGLVASIAILFILGLTLAGLSSAVIKAMDHSPWSLFTVLATLPIAMFMGIYMNYIRPGDYKGATIIGISLLAAALLAGPYVTQMPEVARALTIDTNTLKVLIPVYGLISASLPVWLLMCPRDYLATFLKIGVIGILAVGIFVVQPDLQMPAVTEFFNGGGPVIANPAIPFLFITIACGAISGFHAIIGTGTTPKMIANERDILFVGFGAMLFEGFVALMALIAACSLTQGDYFAINSAKDVFAASGMQMVHLPELSSLVQEDLVGRTGGAVSLAVGMASIFSAVPFMKGLMSYWYHFAIMFEAVFILTAIDAGTRTGRYLLQELLGHVVPKFSDKHWTPGILACGVAFTGAWGTLLYFGDIKTIWPVFGMSNQLLATTGLIIGTTLILKMGQKKYAWVTAGPGLFLIPITFMAGVMNIQMFTSRHDFFGDTLAAISLALMIMMAMVMFDAFRSWFRLLRGEEPLITDEAIAAPPSVKN
jgi:carbon starvation protein